MRERLIFYDAGLITDQINAGEDYGAIKRVITILIVDYVLIPESPRYHNRFTLYDPASAIEFSDLLEINTLELPKLPKMADNYLWHWLRFMRAESMEDLDMVSQASPKLEKVVGKLLELSQDERARMLYEAEVKQERDNRARLRGERIEIARRLLNMELPIENIVKATDLSHEEVEKLRAENSKPAQ